MENIVIITSFILLLINVFNFSIRNILLIIIHDIIYHNRDSLKKYFINLYNKIVYLSHKYYTNNKYKVIELNKILFITGNKNKKNEILNIINKLNINNITSVSLDEIEMDDIKEIQDFDVKIVCENKVKKLHKKISKLIKFKNFDNNKLIIVCDDTGLYCSGGLLNGFPGAYIKDFNYYVGENICKIHDGKQALACTAFSYFDGDKLLTVVGQNTGTIALFPHKGLYGFGFDDYFIPEGKNKTLSEYTIDEKNEFSHRYIAFKELFNSIE
jgi:XTP/dITP diphosphohydrolase